MDSTPLVAPGPWSEEERDVSRREVRAFALAVGADDPRHHDVAVARSSGHRDLLAPRWFHCVLGLSFGRLVPRRELGPEGLPLDDDLSGRWVVAGETQVAFAGDLVAGDVVTVRQRLSGVTRRQGSRGPLELYAYERTYAVAGRIVVSEMFTRIAR